MKRGVYDFCIVVLAVLAYLFICPVSIESHDLWLNVDNHYPKSGQKINIEVVFGHNFPYYDILLEKDKLTEFSYIGPGGQRQEISNIREEKKSEKKGVLVGEISLEQKGTYIIAASRKKKGNKENVPSAKYGKSIVVVEEGTLNFNQSFNHRIEIIPLKNPSDIKIGDSMPVRILFEGKPLSTYIYGTYAGYYSEDEPFAFFTRSNKKGVAYIKISRPGVWMVVCNHKVDFSASLTFRINE